MANAAIALSLLGVGVVGVGALFGCVFCKDGWLSRSYGRRGACSWHGGWRD
jgi:hypothetical protein